MHSWCPVSAVPALSPPACPLPRLKVSPSSSCRCGPPGSPMVSMCVNASLTCYMCSNTSTLCPLLIYSTCLRIFVPFCLTPGDTISGMFSPLAPIWSDLSRTRTPSTAVLWLGFPQFHSHFVGAQKRGKKSPESHANPCSPKNVFIFTLDEQFGYRILRLNIFHQNLKGLFPLACVWWRYSWDSHSGDQYFESSLWHPFVRF